jgi:hypothetical protein
MHFCMLLHAARGSLEPFRNCDSSCMLSKLLSHRIALCIRMIQERLRE